MTTVAVISHELRVLVVDDNVDHRLLIGRRLEERGHAVIGAATGEEALELLAGEPVDVVLLDYRLPDVDGVELLGRLHAPSDPAVVLVTGMGSERVAVDALRSGAADYLAKDQHYLDKVPAVVERAWQHHDHARRARKLQDLALLLQSAGDRAHVLDEVVTGARALLRARSCALLVLGSTGLDLAAQRGATIEDLDEVIAEARAHLGEDAQPRWTDRGERLLVPLPATQGEPVGTLVLVPTRTLTPDDLALAEAFAAFAGIAIANSNRLELERELVTHLQRVIDSRREFLAAISHELRTPLTCIQGFAKTLLERDDTLSAADRQEFVRLITQHSDELHVLVEDLLEVATVQTGRAVTELTVVDLAAELTEATEAVRPLLGDREVILKVDAVSAVADVRLLRRCLANLLSNAAKYSDEHLPITVRTVVDDTTVRVEVADRGVGIDVDEISQVFEPFWRSKSAIRAATRGTGVGLALVREYVRAMGGQVFVESEPGAGSVFAFTLSRDPAQTEVR